MSNDIRKDRHCDKRILAHDFIQFVKKAVKKASENVLNQGKDFLETFVVPQ